jgi:hypothetical protein
VPKLALTQEDFNQNMVVSERASENRAVVPATQSADSMSQDLQRDTLQEISMIDENMFDSLPRQPANIDIANSLPSKTKS